MEVFYRAGTAKPITADQLRRNSEINKLLQAYGLTGEFINVGTDEDLESRIVRKSGIKGENEDWPVVFWNSEVVGGLEDLRQFLEKNDDSFRHQSSETINNDSVNSDSVDTNLADSVGTTNDLNQPSKNSLVDDIKKSIILQNSSASAKRLSDGGGYGNGMNREGMNGNSDSEYGNRNNNNNNNNNPAPLANSNNANMEESMNVLDMRLSVLGNQFGEGSKFEYPDLHGVDSSDINYVPPPAEDGSGEVQLGAMDLVLEGFEWAARRGAGWVSSFLETPAVEGGGNRGRFPDYEVVQTNWYGRQQRRLLRITDTEVQRLHPMTGEIRHTVPFKELVWLTITKDGLQVSFRGDTEREVITDTYSTLYATQIIESIKRRYPRLQVAKEDGPGRYSVK